eukprot:741436-Rhodomonas_salina.1
MLFGFCLQYGVPPNRAAMAVPFLFAEKTLCLWSAGSTGEGGIGRVRKRAVSYTHLTLPTICSV